MSINGGNSTPTPKKSPLVQNQCEFSYSAFGDRDESSLLFLRVEIMGNEIVALLDSRSSRTFLGLSAVDLIKMLHLQFKGSDGKRVTTANSGSNHTDKEGTRSTDYASPSSQILESLPTLTCILGVDFLSMFGIGHDFDTKFYNSSCCVNATGEKTLSPNMAGSQGGARIRRSRRSLPICCGLVEISAEERRLRDFLASEIVGDPSKLGVTNLTEHRIDVGNHAPIKQRYYPSNPVVMIKKSNGTYRFCLDFRRLNTVSKKDAYPLPYMNSILDKLRAARYISTIDLSQVYFQIPLENKSRELTAFTVLGKGLFYFTRMPFGLWPGHPRRFNVCLTVLSDRKWSHMLSLI
ncbi:hypothetical protein ACFW04_014747 [Cataglyphis niger]